MSPCLRQDVPRCYYVFVLSGFLHVQSTTSHDCKSSTFAQSSYNDTSWSWTHSRYFGQLQTSRTWHMWLPWDSITHKHHWRKSPGRWIGLQVVQISHSYSRSDSTHIGNLLWYFDVRLRTKFRYVFTKCITILRKSVTDFLVMCITSWKCAIEVDKRIYDF